MNRVNQVYEDELAITYGARLRATIELNFNTAADMTGADGPCGEAALLLGGSQAEACGSGTLSRNRIVIGQLIGADNYDIGHIALGLNGGGIAGLGVVGRSQQGIGMHRPAQPSR